jgi:hypothetical protein
MAIFSIFLISSTEAAPSLKQINAQTYTENIDLVLAGSMKLNEPGDNSFKTAFLKISNAQPGDFLTGTVSEVGIDATFDAVSGMLTFSGTSSRLSYQSGEYFFLKITKKLMQLILMLLLHITLHTSSFTWSGVWEHWR